MSHKIESYALALILFVPLVLSGQQVTRRAGISDQKLRNLDRVLQQHINQKDFGGFVTLIARNDEVVKKKAYGFCDVEKGVPMDTTAIVPIASMTKIITTLAVLMLYEEGWFKLNDPIEKFVPEFKEVRVFESMDGGKIRTVAPLRKLTIRHLLSHTSGIPYGSGSTVIDSLYRRAGFQSWNRPLKEFVTVLAKIPLLNQPGQRWEYGYSHDVLGYLVEVISEKPLNEFCKERIFDPLGMSNTDFMVSKKRFNRLPQLYQYDSELKAESASTQNAYAALLNGVSGGGGWFTSLGGVCTTVDDFYRIAKLLLHYGTVNGKRLVSRKSIELMVSNQVERAENMKGTEGYGLGIGVRVDAKNYGEISSSGEVYWAGGPYNSFFWVDFKENMIGILFTNTGPFAHQNIMNRFKILAVQAIDD